jgi:ABC-type phosphate transport system substrate-binding protein
MRKLLGIIALLAALSALLGGSLPSAVAAGVSPPVADCSAHGKLTQHYSASELQQALATMPTDVKEYTNCPNVIQQALLAELGAVHGGGGGSGGSSFLPGWVIAVLVVLVLAGAAAGAMAVRNRRRDR